jgi:hypothetical protein
MASGRAADREDPKKSKRRAARSLDRDPISELHQGQRSNAPHQRAEHMTAPDHFAEANLTSFAGGGRPHMIFEDFIWEQIFYAWQLWRLQERVTAVGGDFFEALPAADLYLLRYTCTTGTTLPVSAYCRTADAPCCRVATWP